MNHTCHAARCKRKVPPRLLMCWLHWSMVPKVLQRQVWATYVKGQEVRKNPTPAYMAAHYRAVASVAAREGFTTDAAEAAKLADHYEKQ